MDEPKPLLHAKCPYCESDLPQVESRRYNDIVLICCSSCLKVIAGSYNFKQPEA